MKEAVFTHETTRAPFTPSQRAELNQTLIFGKSNAVRAAVVAGLGLATQACELTVFSPGERTKCPYGQAECAISDDAGSHGPQVNIINADPYGNVFAVPVSNGDDASVPLNDGDSGQIDAGEDAGGDADPNTDAGRGPDAGDAGSFTDAGGKDGGRPDAGVGDTDAGLNRPDASQDADASVLLDDGGSQKIDGGAIPDAGTDAGQGIDGGHIPDAGGSHTDGGSPDTDAGRADAGSGQDAGGQPDAGSRPDAGADAGEPPVPCQENPTCNDNDLCTIGEHCGADNNCIPGTPINTDDGVACTDDICDTSSGQISHLPINENCSTEPCRVNTCDLQEGCVSINLSNTTPCDVIPDVDEQCKDGQCVRGCINDTQCNDDKTCTADSCNQGTGLCEHTPTGACNDANPCNGEEACNPNHKDADSITGCAPAEVVPSCPDDNNSCTEPVCDPDLGCILRAHDELCNDGNPCTGTETCDLLTGCTNPADTNCAFQNTEDGCRVGICDPLDGICKQTASGNNIPCNDGQFCTEHEECQGGFCINGTLKDCADTSLCTNDSCDENNNQCVNAPIDCSDLNDQCNTGICQESDSECVKDPKPNTTECDDEKFCTDADHCQNGNCVSETPHSCSDLKDCTADTCSEADHCVNTPINSACNDNLWCNGEETCTPSNPSSNPNTGCLAGISPNCDNGNLCADLCDEDLNQCNQDPPYQRGPEVKNIIDDDCDGWIDQTPNGIDIQCQPNGAIIPNGSPRYMCARNEMIEIPYASDGEIMSTAQMPLVFISNDPPLARLEFGTLGPLSFSGFRRINARIGTNGKAVIQITCPMPSPPDKNARCFRVENDREDWVDLEFIP